MKYIYISNTQTQESHSTFSIYLGKTIIRPYQVYVDIVCPSTYRSPWHWTYNFKVAHRLSPIRHRNFIMSNSCIGQCCYGIKFWYQLKATLAKING